MCSTDKNCGYLDKRELCLSSRNSKILKSYTFLNYKQDRPHMFILSSFLLFAQQSTATPSDTQQSFFQPLIMMALFLGVMYLLIIRPQNKRQKEMEKQRNSIKEGDQIIAMGIVGTVSAIKETTIIVKMYDGSKIEVLKAAVSEVKSGAPTIIAEKE